MFGQDFFLLSILLAVCAYVYTHILIDTGEILDWWAAFWYNVFGNEKRLSAGEGFHPLYKAFFQCEKCVGGQMGLWTYLALHIDEYRTVSFVLVLQHVLFITLTIFLAAIIKSIIQKLNHGN